MNWKNAWDSARENLQRWYNTAAQWFLFVHLALFLGACVVAGGPVGPIAYINFLYHCCHWNVKGGG
jgi:hypothetical protein